MREYCTAASFKISEWYNSGGLGVFSFVIFCVPSRPLQLLFLGQTFSLLGLSPKLIATKERKGTRKMKTINELCDIVRTTAYAIHVYHGHGHLEKVYENALVHRLRKAGIEVKPQHPINVYDEDGTIIGEYYADLLVDGRIVVELKACRATADEHVAQILGYLKSSRMENGLLINFGSYKFEIKKYIMSTGPTQAIPKAPGSPPAFLFAFFVFLCGKIS